MDRIPALRALIPLVAALASAGAADYPQWRGDGSGATAESGHELVEDLGAARVLWESEERLPTVYSHRGHGDDGPQGGYTNVSVAGGRIYMQYYLPSGEFVEELSLEMTRSMKDPAIWRVDADDVVVCIDAATGSTVWRRTMAGGGANLWALGGLMHSQPCIADGRVFAVGSLGRVYAFSAADGEPLWEGTIGPAHERYAARLAEWKASEDPFDAGAAYRSHKGLKNNLFGGGNGDGLLIACPIVAGGTLVLEDSLGGLLGLDPATGDRRWYREGAIAHKQSPVLWRAGAREYVLAGKGDRVACIDPISGEEVWTVDGAWSSVWLGPTVGDGYMVMPGTKRYGGKPDPGLACFRIDRAGAELVWRLEEGDRELHKSNPYCAPVIHRGHVYVFHNKRGAGRYECYELATGESKGRAEVGHGGMWESLLAADGRILHGWRYLDADPENFRLLATAGKVDEKKGFPEGVPVLIEEGSGDLISADGRRIAKGLPHRGRCATNALVDGVYYYRGYHRLYAVDLRAR